MKKYSLTKESKINAFNKTLFRIRAELDFGFVKKGELGGWIEAENNLDMSGNAWVYGDAEVSGNARVSGNAWVYGDAEVYGKLKITLGYFFGFLFKEEKIEEIKNEDGTTLLWKN